MDEIWEEIKLRLELEEKEGTRENVKAMAQRLLRNAYDQLAADGPAVEDFLWTQRVISLNTILISMYWRPMI